jgi:hypothetical protein
VSDQGAASVPVSLSVRGAVGLVQAIEIAFVLADSGMPRAAAADVVRLLAVIGVVDALIPEGADVLALMAALADLEVTARVGGGS